MSADRSGSVSGEGTLGQVLAGEARWCVVCADSMSILPPLAAGCVDHIITDPPYDSHTHANAKTSKDGGGRLAIGFDPLADAAFVTAFLRLARQWVVCFCALEQLGLYRDAAGAAWVRAGVWNRLAGTAFARADRPYQGAEGIAIANGAASKIFPCGARRAVWDCGTATDEREHPTQKPLRLMLELLSDFTAPNDLILDPFCGSGTTLLAALQQGKRCIGIEIDYTFAELARDRCRAVVGNVRLRPVDPRQENLF